RADEIVERVAAVARRCCAGPAIDGYDGAGDGATTGFAHRARDTRSGAYCRERDDAGIERGAAADYDVLIRRGVTRQRIFDAVAAGSGGEAEMPVRAGGGLGAATDLDCNAAQRRVAAGCDDLPQHRGLGWNRRPGGVHRGGEDEHTAAGQRAGAAGIDVTRL